MINTYYFIYYFILTQFVLITHLRSGRLDPEHRLQASFSWLYHITSFFQQLLLFTFLFVISELYLKLIQQEGELVLRDYYSLPYALCSRLMVLMISQWCQGSNPDLLHKKHVLNSQSYLCSMKHGISSIFIVFVVGMMGICRDLSQHIKQCQEMNSYLMLANQVL